VGDQVVWHGSAYERDLILELFAKNCTCEYHEDNQVRKVTCASHQAMLDSQRFMDGLVYARRLAKRLKEEEAMQNSSGRGANDR
jgi:hypothetical protein